MQFKFYRAKVKFLARVNLQAKKIFEIRAWRRV